MGWQTDIPKMSDKEWQNILVLCTWSQRVCKTIRVHPNRGVTSSEGGMGRWWEDTFVPSLTDGTQNNLGHTVHHTALEVRTSWPVTIHKTMPQGVLAFQKHTRGYTEVSYDSLRVTVTSLWLLTSVFSQIDTGNQGRESLAGRRGTDMWKGQNRISQQRQIQMEQENLMKIKISIFS